MVPAFRAVRFGTRHRTSRKRDERIPDVVGRFYGVAAISRTRLTEQRRRTGANGRYLSLVVIRPTRQGRTRSYKPRTFYARDGQHYRPCTRETPTAVKTFFFFSPRFAAYLEESVPIGLWGSSPRVFETNYVIYKRVSAILLVIPSR